MKVRVTSRATTICRCHAIVDDDSSSDEEEEEPMKVNIVGQYGPRRGPFPDSCGTILLQTPVLVDSRLPKG
jgi:hypothetical protein